MEKIVVIDNGAGSCRVGFAGRSAPERVFPNGTAKLKGENVLLVGDELLGSREVSELAVRRPFDKGYLVDWKMEKDVWTRAVRTVLQVNPRDCGLVLSEPMFNFPQLQAATEEMVFEDFGFQSYYTAPAPIFSLQRGGALQPHIAASRTGCGVVVDAGFSFTHIVPFFNGVVVASGVKRINVGGKALTNYLKELVSFRSFNMMDETFLVESVKEQLCFVSCNVRADLKLASQPGLRSPHRREYVLPCGEYGGYYKELSQAAAAAVFAAGGPPPAVTTLPPPATAKRFADKVESQALVLNNERFMVPEVLFNPSDIGLDQAGVAEAVAHAVRAVHPAMQPLITENVLLTGGLACCPGFLERFRAELRPQISEDCGLHVFLPKNPDLCAWEGMSQFGASQNYRARATTKAQYEENGRGRTQGRQQH